MTTTKVNTQYPHATHKSIENVGIVAKSGSSNTAKVTFVTTEKALVFTNFFLLLIR